MPGDSDQLREKLRKLAATGPIGPVRAAPPFDEEYLIRCLAYLLRHSSSDRGVALDSRGWASVDEIVDALRRMHWSLGDLSAAAVTDFVLLRADDRFEAAAGQVRARYGHSIAGLAVGEPEIPPEILFHCTTTGALDSVRELGLRPMGRSHVQLTSDVEYARSIALVGGRSGTVLVVEAKRASDAGVLFVRAGGHVWLAGAIEARFILKDGAAADD